jgi:hypothetical protein
VEDEKPKVSASKQKAIDCTPTISESQVAELVALEASCDPEYMAKLFNYLESQGVKGFTQVKESDFKKILTGMTKNAEVYAKQKSVTHQGIAENV